MNPVFGDDNPYQFEFPVQLPEYQNLPPPEASYVTGASYPLPTAQDEQYRAFESQNDIRAEDAEKREEPGTIDPALLAFAIAAFAAPIDASESTPPADEWTPAPSDEETLLYVGELDCDVAEDSIADAQGAAVTLGATPRMRKAEEDTALPFPDASDFDNEIDDDAIADVQGAAVTLPTHGMSKAAAKKAAKEVDAGDDERYTCPVDGCTQTFVVRSTLERHLWSSAVPCANNCGKLIKRGNDESTMRRHIERWCKNTPKETRKKNIAAARDKALWEKRKRAAAATPSPPPERPTKRKRAHSV